MSEREPGHIILDLSKKAADDASDAIRRTVQLVDHAQDKIAIMIYASMATCGGALGAFSLHPDNAGMGPEELVDGLMLMMRPGMLKVMESKAGNAPIGG